MQTVPLPPPRSTGDRSFEEVLNKRRSIREFADPSPSAENIGQLAWAAQGITDDKKGLRVAPSAGAIYPMEVYLLVSGIADIPDGIYLYRNRDHSLQLIAEGDLRRELYSAALSQDAIIKSPVVMVLTGDLHRTEQQYGQRALRYLFLEAGHMAQNVYLQATAMDIGTVVIGSFVDQGVRQVLQIDKNEIPLYIMPVGIPK